MRPSLRPSRSFFRVAPSIALLLLLFASAGCDGDGVPGGEADGGQTSDSGTGADAGAPVHGTPVMGIWRGTAAVDEGEILLGGEFPATMAIAQSGSTIRGILDIRQDVDILAESFGYLLEGTIDGDRLVVQATDRLCAATEPEDLCYPAAPPFQKAFRLSGRLVDGTLVWDLVEPLQGVTYPEGVAVEPPFRTLSLALDEAPYQDGDRDVSSRWEGETWIFTSVVFLNPLPFYGQNSMRVEGAPPVMTEFVNDLAGEVVPRFDDLILPSSLDVDPATGRFWFVQTANPDYRWLWTGVLRGNKLSGTVVFDFSADPMYDPGRLPIDPASAPFVDVAAVFSFTAP